MRELFKLTTVKAGPNKKRYRPTLHAEVTTANLGSQTDAEAHDKYHEPEFEAEGKLKRFMRRFFR